MMREQRDHFATSRLKNGTDLEILRSKAENQENWIKGAKDIVQKDLHQSNEKGLQNGAQQINR
jgi:hypothetical protein